MEMASVGSTLSVCAVCATCRHTFILCGMDAEIFFWYERLESGLMMFIMMIQHIFVKSMSILFLVLVLCGFRFLVLGVVLRNICMRGWCILVHRL